MDLQSKIQALEKAKKEALEKAEKEKEKAEKAVKEKEFFENEYKRLVASPVRVSMPRYRKCI